MLKLLLNSDFIKGKTCTGVFVFINPDSSYRISVCNLKKSKKSVFIQKYASDLNSLTELNKYCNTKTPIVLCLDGKGIIHKSAPVSLDLDKTEAVHKIFPNANASDFMITIDKITDSNSMLSLARNEVISEVVSKLPDGLFVIEYILGPMAINQILPLLLHNNSVLKCDTYSLKISNNKIAEIEKVDLGNNKIIFNIGGENIPDNVIIAFSAAFRYFTGNEESVCYKADECSSNDFFYKRIFTYSGWIALFVIFFILLANFIVFDNYRQRQSELSSRLSVNQDLLKQIDTLKNELSVKQIFIEKNGLLSFSKQSFYADRIASSIPDNVNLSLMKQCPLKTKLIDQIQPDIQNDVILIEGESKNSVRLNEWINKLSLENWIEQVDVTNYSQENSNSRGKFSIKIKLKVF